MAGLIMRRVHPAELVVVLGIHLVLSSSLIQISEGANAADTVTSTQTSKLEETSLHAQKGFTNTSANIQGNMTLQQQESLYLQNALQTVLSSAWKLRTGLNQSPTSGVQLNGGQEKTSALCENFLKWPELEIANNELMESQEEGFLLHMMIKANETDDVRCLLLIGAAASEQDPEKNTPLNYAVRIGAHDIIKLLLKAGADPNLAGAGNSIPLEEAAELGDTEAVRILIHEGSNAAQVFKNVIRSRNHNALKVLIEGIGVFPKSILNIALEEAIKNDDREAIRLLITAEAEDDPFMEHTENYPWDESIPHPMSEATACGREDILKQLLETWGYVNERNRWGQNPLMTAAFNNNPRSVRMLVSAGASLEDEDNFNETALFYATHSGADALSALLDLGANVNATNGRGDNALHKAVLQNPAAVDVLLDAGVDKEARNNEGRTPIFMAPGPSKDTLQLLLKANVSHNVRDNYNRTPFLHHVSISDEQGTAVLLNLSPDLEEQDENGDNALLLAAKQASAVRRAFPGLDSEEFFTNVKMLVEAGADVDAQNYEGVSALLWFVDTGFIPAAEYMLSVGADKDIRDVRGYTPLHSAAEKGKAAPLEMLLRSGVDVEARDRLGRTPLMVAAASKRQGGRKWNAVPYPLEVGAASYWGEIEPTVNAVPYLLDAGAMVNARDDSGLTALHFAAKNGVDSVKLLLEKGADIHATDVWGRTPLHWTVGSDKAADTWGGAPPYWTVGNEAPMKELLNAGADKNAQDVSGSTPLLLSMHEECDSCLRTLLQAGADVNIPDKKGVTPAMFAIEQNKYIEMLSKAGADLDARDNEGSTALHRATVNGSINAMKFLLEKKVTVDAKENNGTTPLHLASERNNLKALEALLAAGADVNLPDGSGKTALHWAAGKGGERMVKRLIQARADVNAEDREKKTPLWDAVFSNDAPSAALLVSAGADVNHERQGRTPLDSVKTKSDATAWKGILQETKTTHIEDAKGNIR